MTLEQEQVKITLDLEAQWEAFGRRLFDEIIWLKQRCGQAAFCLAAPCAGKPGAPAKLVQTLHDAAAGVAIPALPEMTPQEVAEFDRKVLERYPLAVFVDGQWQIPDVQMNVTFPKE